MRNFSFFRQLSPPAQLVGLALLALFCGITLGQLTLLVATRVFGLPLPVLGTEALLQTTADLDIKRVLQVSISVGLFLVPALIFGASSGFQRPFMRGKLLALPLLLAVLVGACMVAPSGAIYALTQAWEPTGIIGQWLGSWRTDSSTKDAFITALISDRRTGAVVLNVALLCILPAVAEELFFRGAMQRVLHRWSGRLHGPIWLTATIFGVIHFEFDGLLVRIALGAMLGYAFAWSANIFVPIALHAAYNATAVLVETALIYAGKNAPTINTNTYLTGSGWWLALVGAAVGGACLFALRNVQRMRDPHTWHELAMEPPPPPPYDLPHAPDAP